ncbi:MAG: XisI protein [Bacteroidota bacterium]
MDSVAKITHYRTLIRQIIEQHAPYPNPRVPEEFDTQLLLDDEQGHYYLMYVGWDGYRRIHACLIHMDLKGEKIWVQRDGTEYGVANELVDLGVPREDIVLGFQAPYKRPYTDFAAA